MGFIFIKLHYIKKMHMLKKDLKPLFFKVEKVPAKNFASDLSFANDLSHWIIAHTPDGPRVVNSCSKGYTLLTNEDLILPIAERLEKDYKVETKITNTDYSKFYVDFMIKDQAFEVIKKDMIFPRIRINNSYDGKVKYSFHFGFYRVVCDNGMTVIDKGMSRDIKLMHTPKSMGNNAAVTKTLDIIEHFLEAAPALVQNYKDLAKRKITWDAAMEKINEILEETKYPKKAKEVAIAKLKEEMGQFPLSDYLLYNALNFGLYTNPESQMKTHKKDKVDKQILNFIVND